MSRLFITACRRNMSTKKLSTKLCRQNEFDQICCRPINFRRSVWRQSFVDKVSFDKTYCRQMICNSLVTSMINIFFLIDSGTNERKIRKASNVVQYHRLIRSSINKEKCIYHTSY